MASSHGLPTSFEDGTSHVNVNGNRKSIEVETPFFYSSKQSPFR